MGWIYEQEGAYEHEGYAVPVLADGTEGDTARGGWWVYDGRDGRALAVAVRAACECGWRSDASFPADLGDQDRTEGWENGTGPYAAWWEHVSGGLATTVPPDLSQAVSQVGRCLAQLAEERPLAALEVIARLEQIAASQAPRAGRAARAQHATWDAIGRALGVSRQAAQQRLGRHAGEGHR
jgi:hypothetical protein